MPNIPNLPGVPPLTDFSVENIVLLVADTVSQLFGDFAPQWGIFLDGAPALPEANSTLTFGYKRDWTISDYPIQQGAFESYDKVQLPFDVRVKVVSGSTGADRQALLDAVDTIGDSLELYDIVTPEKVYPSLNCNHVDYDRSAASGVGMIMIDLWFVQIRVEATATFSNTQQPPNAGQQGAGNIQAVPATSSSNQQVEQNFNDGTWTVQ